jgi:hypothetical protein
MIQRWLGLWLTGWALFCVEAIFIVSSEIASAYLGLGRYYFDMHYIEQHKSEIRSSGQIKRENEDILRYCKNHMDGRDCKELFPNGIPNK